MTAIVDSLSPLWPTQSLLSTSHSCRPQISKVYLKFCWTCHTSFCVAVCLAHVNLTLHHKSALSQHGNHRLPGTSWENVGKHIVEDRVGWMSEWRSLWVHDSSDDTLRAVTVVVRVMSLKVIRLKPTPESLVSGWQVTKPAIFQTWDFCTMFCNLDVTGLFSQVVLHAILISKNKIC